MPQSKADKLADFIERMIRDEVAEYALDRINDQTRQPYDLFKYETRRGLACGLRSRLKNPYAWRELLDIMAWKRPREVD